MTTNLALSQTFEAHVLQVDYLSAGDIPVALDLIARIKTSGCLNKAYHLKGREEEELIQLSKDGYPLLGIKNVKGELISFATVSKMSGHDDVLIIRSLCTSPEVKGSGCGSKMIDAAVLWMKENGDGIIMAKVASDNQASLSLFSKAGFKATDLQWDDREHYCYYMMTLKDPDFAPPAVGWSAKIIPSKASSALETNRFAVSGAFISQGSFRLLHSRQHCHHGALLLDYSHR